MPTANTKELSQYSEKDLSGFYRAIVTNNQDPERLARVQVRVPMIHGQNSSNHGINNSELPWATPILPTGAGYDHGSCMVPEVGDIVIILFEDNDRNYPMYLGGCYGKGGENKQYGSDTDPSTYNGGTWSMPNGLPEIPKEVYNSSGSPTGKVIYKSPKGATIVVEEEDGKESIRILDALGQSIRLSSSITKTANNLNGGRRINGDAYSGTGGDSERLCNAGYSEIAITSARGQQIQMLDTEADSSISILAGVKGADHQIILDQEGVKVNHEGNQLYLLDKELRGIVGGYKIDLHDDGSASIQGKSKLRIHTDGKVEIDGPGKITIFPDGRIELDSTTNLKLESQVVEIDSNTCIIRGNLINYSL